MYEMLIREYLDMGKIYSGSGKLKGINLIWT